MNNEKDILYKLKWFNNPDNHKGTDTVAWIPRKVLAEAIAEIRDLREQAEDGELVKNHSRSLDEIFSKIPTIPDSKPDYR